jgi:hypothetical protein
MSTSDAPRRRRPFVLLKLAVFLVVIGGVAALVMSAFKVGLMIGLASAAGGLVVYTIPAAIFDWPRFSLGDIGDFFVTIFESIYEAIASFFGSWFD